MDRRIKKEMNDIECQLLIDCLLRTTTSADKVNIEVHCETTRVYEFH